MKYVWFIAEIWIYIITVMSTIMGVWIYTPFEYWIKGMITILIGTVTVDVFKKYVYTKWILEKHKEEST